jgi:hypothetical protein
MDDVLSQSLSRLKVEPKSGEEQFRLDGRDLGFSVLDFWRWSVSDLMSNATRGRLAEFIVAKALSIPTDGVRDEWGAYDLLMTLEGIREGIKIEVKSAAYLQSWQQARLSSIGFLTRKTRAWDPERNRQDLEPKRQANVYVFALLAHQSKSTIDPLNLHQWKFYVLPSSTLDARTRSQHSITLRTLEASTGGPVTYDDLRAAVVLASQPSHL